MPGIGNQHLRAHALRHRQHVTEHAFFGGQRNQRNPESERVYRLHLFRVLQAQAGVAGATLEQLFLALTGERSGPAEEVGA